MNELKEAIIKLSKLSINELIEIRSHKLNNFTDFLEITSPDEIIELANKIK